MKIIDTMGPLVVACAGLLLAYVGITNMTTARDDSDPPGSRSGMIIFTDALTGCQYLKPAGIGGALTPRNDKNGNQICVKGN